VLNPLFHRRGVAKKQYEANYNKFALAPSKQALASAGKSSWTKPITIDPSYFFFFVSGSPHSELAKVPVWHLYDGVWRDGMFNESPGDPIGGDAKITLASGIDQNISLAVGDLMIDLTNAGSADGGQSVRLLYLNHNTGSISQRRLNDDQSSSARTRLENEQAVGQLLAGIFSGRNQQQFNPYASPKQRQQGS